MTLTGTGNEEQRPRFWAASGFSCSSTRPGVDPPAAPPPAAPQSVPSSLSRHPITVCSRDGRLKAAQSQHLSADANPPLNGTIPPICSRRENACVLSVPPGPSQAYNHVHPPPGQSHHLAQCTMSRTRAEHPGASKSRGPLAEVGESPQDQASDPGGRRRELVVGWEPRRWLWAPPNCAQNPIRDRGDYRWGVGVALVWEPSRKEEEVYTGLVCSARETSLEKEDADPSPVGPGPTALDSRARR